MAKQRHDIGVKKRLMNEARLREQGWVPRRYRTKKKEKGGVFEPDGLTLPGFTRRH